MTIASRSELSPELVKLIEANLERVRIIAWTFKRKLPRQVEFDELVAWGNLRLVECAYRFDINRGSFGTFARHNIVGAMYDFLRQCDLAPRSERRARREAESQQHAEEQQSHVNRRHIPIDGQINVGAEDASLGATRARLDVVKLMSELSTESAYVIEQYFLKDRPQNDIARELHLCESRISQIVKQAIDRMRLAAEAPTAMRAYAG